VSGLWHRAGRSVRDAALEFLFDWRAVVRYLIQPETHVFAFSIAATVLLAFYPFLLVMLSICKHVFHSTPAIEAIFVAIQDYFPGGTGAFLVDNLARSLKSVRHMEWFSVLMLLLLANGVFLPLEVALNRAWGVVKGRNLVMNQVLSTGLIFVCGALALLSAVITAAAPALWLAIFGADAVVPVVLTKGYLAYGLFKLASIPFTILILFLVYWKLPNTKVPALQVLPRAVVIGLLLEMLKWINWFAWPWLFAKFQREYGVFRNSITILTWSFFAGLIVLAGADWSARRARAAEAAATDSEPATPVAAPLEAFGNPGPTGRIG
jgi:YihY family inner membrane protein